jgi:hypothetical protein
MLTSFLGLSNGHLTVCVLAEAPKGYKVGVWAILSHHGCFQLCIPEGMYMLVFRRVQNKMP